MKCFRFFVDGTPIRVFKNTKDKGGSYRTQAMKVYATMLHYRSFGINALKLTIDHLASMLARLKALTLTHVIPLSIGGMLKSFGS
jgi:hypothetical protein